MYTFDNYQLGINDDEVRISTSEEHLRSATLMAQQSRRSICIISRELDPHVYNLPDFVEAVKKTLLANRRANVRIIVFEGQTIARRGHLLLNLADKLPSYIEFRKPGIEYNSFNESVFIADNTGFIYRNSAERFEGNINFSDRRKSKTLMDVFEEMWNRSAPDPNLRGLSL
ncbi:MAG: hypothetical protein ACI909_000886 [Planctomycetota bacterium]|jgi:hypothetical protein